MNKNTNNKIKSANSLTQIKKPGELNQTNIGELLEKLEDLDIICSLNSAINQGKSLKEIIKLFSSQTKKIFASLGATVYLLSDDSKYLIMQNSTIPPGIEKKVENIIRIKIPEIKISLKKESTYSRALEQMKPQLLNGPEDIEKLIYDFAQTVKLKNKILYKAFKKLTPKIHKLLNINSVLIVPLISNGKPIGVIDISREKPFRNSDLERFKTISGVMTTAINKKITEDQLKDSHDQLNTIFKTGIDSMRIIDLDFNVLRVNKQFCELSGKTEKELLTKKCYELLSGPLCHKSSCVLKQILGGESKVEKEIKKIRSDNKVVPCLITARPLKDTSGKIIGIVESFKDITMEKQSQERYRSLFENSLDGVYRVTLEGKYLDFNPAFMKMLGYSRREELLKVDVPTHVYVRKEDRPKPDQRNKIFETQFKKKDSSQITVEISSRVKYQDNKPVYFENIIRDITEKKKAEIMLKTEKETAQKYLDIAGVMIVILDNNGKVSLINKRGCEILGYRKDDIIGKNWFDNFLPKETKPEIIKVARKIFSGKARLVEYYENPVLTRSGKERIISWHNTVLNDDNGKIIAILSSGEDITEKKEAEKRLQHLNIILNTLRNVNRLIIKEKDKRKLIESICKVLVEKRGYYNAWLALVDDKGKLTEIVESGVDKDFQVLTERINKGKLTACWKKAMSSSDIIINKDPKKDCRGCPLAEHYSGRGAMTVMLKRDKKVYGVFSVSTPLEYIESKEDKSLFAEIAGDISVALYSLELEEKRKEAEKAIKIERDGLISILDSMADGVYIVDKNYTIEYINPVLKKEFGPIGKRKCYEYFHGLKKVCPWCKNKEVFKGKTVRWEWYSKKNKKSYDLMDTPLKNIDGTISKLEIFRDITDIKKSEEEIKNSYQKLQKTLSDTINTLASIVEIRDPYTSGHQKRVAALAVSISKELGLEKDKIEAVGTAALIHDIGKINIPTSILARPGKISLLEYDMIKTHPQVSYDMVKRIEFPWPIADIILQHHEKLDGSGYPKGLKGKDIILEARILTVADIVEAMSSHRPYRPALGMDKALKEIRKGKGKLYDAEVVEACVKIITKKGFKF